MPGYDGIEMEGELTETGGHPGSDGQQGAAGAGAGGNGQPGTQTDGQQGGGQPQAGDQQTNTQGQQEVFDGSKWVLKYRGSPYTPKSRDELVNLAQKGFSYEQEMGRFKNERQQLTGQLEALRKQYAHYDEFDGLLKGNPALQEKIAQLIQEMNAGGGANGGQGGGANFQLINKLMGEINDLKGFRDEFTNAEYDRKVAASLEKLKSSHPDHDWEHDDGTGNLEKKILQFALENGITNLDVAYRAMMFDHAGTNASAAALKKAAEDKQRAAKAGIIQSGAAPGGGGMQKGGYKPGMSYNELARQMEGELKT
jgi:hypothetical protein